MPQLSLDDGVELYYEVHGTGTPLLLAAGLGGACTYWHEQIDAFANSCQLVLYDQRGTGRSSHVPVESVEQLAKDTVQLLDRLDIERVHYVGHSTGGAIGQVLAIEHPERLISLVIYASTAKSDSFRRRIWDLRLKILETLGPSVYARLTTLLLFPSWWISANDERLAREEEQAAKMLSEPEVVASRIDAILKFDRVADLHRITTPTLVLCAKDDNLTPPYFSQQLADEIPGATLLLMDRGGHACSKTMPDEFNSQVLAFVNSY